MTLWDDPNVPIIYQPSWDYSFTGQLTGIDFLAGCHAPSGYGDRWASGIGIRSRELPTYLYSCQNNDVSAGYCNIYMITGRANHRAATFRSDLDESTWIK